MKKTLQQTHTTTTPAEMYARSLLQYAATSELFADWLASYVETCCGSVAEYFPVTHTSTPRNIPRYLLPADEIRAAARARWLVGTIETRSLRGWENAAILLVEWARAHECADPKAIVLGIEVGVLPIGIMGKMRSKREPMSVLIRTDVAHQRTATCLYEILVLTHQVVERALIQANGSTKHLEPELGDWLFGDKELQYLSTTGAALESIRTSVDTWSIPHASLTDGDSIALLVLSPTVCVNVLDEAPLLEPLDRNQLL